MKQDAPAYKRAAAFMLWLANDVDSDELPLNVAHQEALIGAVEAIASVARDWKLNFASAVRESYHRLAEEETRGQILANRLARNRQILGALWPETNWEELFAAAQRREAETVAE